MSRIAATFRFVVGLAMVAGGTALVAPLATRLATAVRSDGPPAAVLGQATPPMDAPPGMVPPAPGLAVGGMPVGTTPEAAAFDVPPIHAESSPALPLQADYRPPTPPVPLPPLPVEFALPNSQLAGAYRSTLDVPPPPLLDSQGPPPLAVAWTAHGPTPPVTASVSAAAVPAAYRVRDGDDLAGIAARFYGHPAAAAAVWSANRDVIADPGLLPIGAVLRLPPPEALRAWGVGATGGGIEPAMAPAPTPVAGRVMATPVSAAVPPTPWLGGPGAPASAPPAVASPPPRLVRVGPGETLASIARRFYGDPAQASRIWEANRDRLRGPELVVPGMELRLPE
jgi:nucleoid-associated protein YgaU